MRTFIQHLNLDIDDRNVTGVAIYPLSKNWIQNKYYLNAK